MCTHGICCAIVLPALQPLSLITVRTQLKNFSPSTTSGVTQFEQQCSMHIINQSRARHHATRHSLPGYVTYGTVMNSGLETRKSCWYKTGTVHNTKWSRKDAFRMLRLHNALKHMVSAFTFEPCTAQCQGVLVMRATSCHVTAGCGCHEMDVGLTSQLFCAPQAAGLHLQSHQAVHCALWSDSTTLLLLLGRI